MLSQLRDLLGVDTNPRVRFCESTDTTTPPLEGVFPIAAFDRDRVLDVACFATSCVDLSRERVFDFVEIAISSSSEAENVLRLAVSSERRFGGVCIVGAPFNVALLRVVRNDGDSLDEVILFRFILVVGSTCSIKGENREWDDSTEWRRRLKEGN